MTITVSRRDLVSAAALAGAALACPDALFAATGRAEPWTLGVADVEADIAPRVLSRLHGKAPAGLAGTLYRNGPAKFRRGTTASGHWFDGDGLMRAFTLPGDGSARLAARFADTPKRRTETAAGAIILPGFGTRAGSGAIVTSADDANPANTSVIMAGGELLALWEAGSALRMDPATLETRGFKTFRPDLKGMPFLAHPRIEPDGRIWNLSMSGSAALVWRLARDGTLETAQGVKLPRASYLHDFTATARHLVIVLQPWIQDRMMLPFVDSLSWRPDMGTQVLVIDKADLTRQRLYELPAFAFFHLGDAWEESDGTIRFDGCIEADPTFGTSSARDLVKGVHHLAPMPILGMIALFPDGRASLTPSGTAAEFPRSNPRIAGQRRSATVHVGTYRTDRPFAQAVGVWDWTKGADDAHDFGGDHLTEEFVLVPRRGARSETDGWLLGTTVNLKAGATELHVFDAARVAAGPLVSWRADVAMPVGFHGTFVAGLTRAEASA
ncbi:MAG: carotenoid oxygenase family protein [Sandarakinorhabdus sp.]|nr:carotenoid oxygenase family protein [Sandarakinorhabdus sp.]